MLFDTISYVTGADFLYDITGSTLSTPSDGTEILRFVAPRDFTIPANLAGTVVETGTNPGSTATLKVKRGVGGGAQNDIATITINTSGVETLPTQSAVTVAAGDVITVVVETASSLDNLGITIKTVAS